MEEQVTEWLKANRQWKWADNLAHAKHMLSHQELAENVAFWSAVVKRLEK